jgi:creatinine amidohydrolase/Fe(II)-dependent formamide hydrolase-like protein
MKNIALIALSVTVLAGTIAVAQQPGAAGQQRQRREPDPRDMGGGQCAQNPYNCVDATNPLPAPNTVWLEEMTWIDVRDALKAGKTNVIVPTGGMEPNGVWLVTGKHNYVLHANCEAIARKMGNALCAPIVKFVPEGNIEPKSGHMVSPGTITAREETYQALLTDIAESLQAHGFKTIVFIGDSGGNQDGMKEVAATLNAAWTDGKTRVLFIPEYYDYPGVQKWLETQGVKQTNEGHHDDFQITAEMMVVDPASVRLQERIAAGKASINGVPIAPAEKAIEWGRKIVDYRAEITVKAIKDKLAEVRSTKSGG